MTARPIALRQGRRGSAVVLVLLVGSAAAIALAPLALPPGYDWVRHTTSESAAQSLHGAWVARTGFLLWGLAVVGSAVLLRGRWGGWGSLALGTFGVMMLGTAAYSHRPWLTGVPYDATEDLLHSVTASVMGLAFAIGVVLVGLRRSPASRGSRVLDATAVLSSVALPLAMTVDVAHTGAWQRLMFVVAYAWFAREAVRGRDGGAAVAAVLRRWPRRRAAAGTRRW